MLVSHGDIQRRFHSLSPFLDERMRRLVAAAESEAIGYGGVSAVARATGVSRRAITGNCTCLSAVMRCSIEPLPYPVPVRIPVPF